MNCPADSFALLCAASGGSSLGHPEEPASHELWQAEPLAALLLWEGHHAEGKSMFAHLFFFLSLLLAQEHLELK